MGKLGSKTQAHTEKACWKRGEGMENPSAPLHELENGGGVEDPHN
jgi:hypothetical protein